MKPIDRLTYEEMTALCEIYEVWSWHPGMG